MSVDPQDHGYEGPESPVEPLPEDVMVLDEVPDPDAVLPVWEPTGNATVDAALEELHAVAGSDLGAHAEIYERLQQSLRSTLDGLAADHDSV